MKILVLTSRFPYPLEKGDKLRAFYQIRELSYDHEIILCALSTHKVSEESFQTLAEYCKSIHVFSISTAGSIWNIGMGLMRGLPVQVGYFFRKNIAHKLERIIEQEQPDHLYCQLIRMSEYVRKKHIPKTLDYMDSFSLGMVRRAAKAPIWQKRFIRWEASLLKKYEKHIYADFDFHTIISNTDREQLSLDTLHEIRIVPNGVDTQYFSPVASNLPKEPVDIAFVGNMGYFPNVHAAKFLALQIMPLIWEQFPNTNLLLAGARPHPSVIALSKDSRINVSGWIPDIRTAYQHARIFVAPLFTGSGQQNKILEAMAMKLPCITTPAVRDAIHLLNTHAPRILTASTAESFAKQTTELLKDPHRCEVIGESNRKWVVEQMSWANAVSKLNALWAE